MGTNFFSQHFVNEPTALLANDAGEEYYSLGGADINSPAELQSSAGRGGLVPSSTINGAKIRYMRGYFYAPEGAIEDWHFKLQIRMLRVPANGRVLDAFLSTGKYLPLEKRTGSPVDPEYWTVDYAKGLTMQNQDQGGNTQSYQAPYGRDDLDNSQGLIGLDDRFQTDSAVRPLNYQIYTFTQPAASQILVNQNFATTGARVYVKSTGTLHSGLYEGVTYWLKDVSGSTKELWDHDPSEGGVKVSFGSGGTGTHQIWLKAIPESNRRTGEHHPGHDRLNFHYFRHSKGLDGNADDALLGQARESDEASDPVDAKEGPMKWGEPFAWEIGFPTVRYAALRDGDHNYENRHWVNDVILGFQRISASPHWGNAPPEKTEVGVLMEMYYISPED